VQVTWLTADPAKRLLEEAGEVIHPESENWAVEAGVVEKVAKGMQVSLTTSFLKLRNLYVGNVDIYRRVSSNEDFDLIILDGAFEISAAIRRDPSLKRRPQVFILGWVGLDVLSHNPIERLAALHLNRRWGKGYREKPVSFDLCIFLGEPEDIPNKRFGLLLPNRRESAKSWFQFVGYVSRCQPDQHTDRPALRKSLGYGPEPLVVCSIGGTAIGRELLELCGSAYLHVRETLGSLRMILVCGPRLSPDSVKAPPNVEVRGYVPKLYEHFAASDLAVVQGGGTSTYELAALRRPFIYFPIEHHCEQAVVAGRLARLGAGVRMSYPETTPQMLADQIVRNIGKEADYPPVPLDGAKMAARLIAEFLSAQA
jgi:UDP:flavonoid glycosyltransferase YjiC (YdhE family)